MRAKRPYEKKRKRVGRGSGSGHGKTSTRGHKGQRARSGFTMRGGFEGGQNPLYRRLPKRGFNRNAFRQTYSIVNVGDLPRFNQGEISPELLAEQGVLKQHSLLKILGNGELSQALTVRAHKFSGSAKEKIEKAGGKAVLIE